MQTSHRQLVNKELQRIASRHRGVLRPVNVVAYAEDPQTELHGEFTWDDSAAAHQHRLWQARQIIRVSLIRPTQAVHETRAYVSLMSDRRRDGGGYRSLVAVMSDADRRAELLDLALRDMQAFSAKYRELAELGEVFAAMEKAASSLVKEPAREPVSV